MTTATMHAIVHDTYGSEPADVLRLAEADRPAPARHEVVVRVHAASVDRGTWHIMAGLPYPIRVAGFGFRTPKHLNPGRSFAGTVDAVGADVSGFVPGDAVYGLAAGAFAEYVVARPDRLAAKPASLSFGEAAAVPLSGTTALQAVRDRGRVGPGQRVLVVGASGGVGTFAVQIAKAFGAEVTGVCGPSKVDLVRGLGADVVVDYTREGLPRGFDVILDIGGNTPLSALRAALTPAGRLVIVGGETAGRWLGGTDRQVRATLLSPFVRHTLGTFVASENAADLDVLRDLVEAGLVRPVVDRTYALGDVAAAIGHVTGGHARGKVVVTVRAGGAA